MPDLVNHLFAVVLVSEPTLESRARFSSIAGTSDRLVATLGVQPNRDCRAGLSDRNLVSVVLTAQLFRQRNESLVLGRSDVERVGVT